MTLKSTILTLFLSCFVSIGIAQQLAPFASNFNQPILTNPAYTGYHDQAQAFFLYRKQWASLPDSPETAIVNLDGRLTNKMGLGFSVMNDRQNILGRTGAYLSYSYIVQLNDDQKLHFGAQAGAFQNQILFNRIDANDFSDEALLVNAQSKLSPDFNIGLMWQWKKLELGVSSFQILGNSILHEYQSEFKSARFNLIRHFNASARYRFELENEWSLNPMLMLRSVQGLPIQGDLAVFAKKEDLFWAGLGYRYNNAAFAQVGFQLFDQVKLSYVVEVPTSAIATHTSASHELVLGLVLKGKQPQDTRAQRKLAKELDQLKDQNQMLSEQASLLKQEIEQLKKEIKAKSTQESVSNEELEELKNDLLQKIKEQTKLEVEKYEPTFSSREEFEEKATTLKEKSAEKNKQNQVELSPLRVQKDVRDQLGATEVSATEIDNMFKEVKKVEMTDLESKNYHLVLGAYYDEKDTELYQNYLATQNIDASTVSDPANNMTYVVVNPKNNLAQNIEEMEQIIKPGFLINGNPWVFIENK
jgi:type IX secretion system PorP/SprF family membrane protein